MADNNPSYTSLDFNQIFQRAFEEESDRIRVDAQVTATLGTVEVIISAASGDNIQLSDGTNFVGVTVGGELKVSDAGLASLNAKFIDDYGAPSLAIRTASQIGNTSGQADFNTGATGAQTLRTVSNTNDGSGNSITSSSYNSARALNTLVQDATSVATPLNNTNVNVQLSLAGLNSVGFQLAAGTFIGTLIAECSIDGGTSWGPVAFYDSVNSAVLTNLTFNSANPLTIVSIIPIGGSSHARVRVTTYISGTANGIIRATQVAGTSGTITSAAFGSVANATVSIPNNTVTLILPANPNRKYAYFGNNGSSTIRMQFFTGTGLTPTTGIPVASSIGFYELKGDNLFTGNVYALSADDTQISVTEGTP